MKEERMYRDEGMMRVRSFSIVFVLAILLPLWFTDSTTAQGLIGEVPRLPDQPGIDVNVSDFKELARGNATDGIWSVSWSPDETKIVSGQRDNLTVIRDASNLSVLKTLSGHTWGVGQVACLQLVTRY